MKTKVGMDLGGENVGPDGKRLRRCTVSVFAAMLENQGFMQIVQADCARARGGGAPPAAPRPPLAINALWCAGWRAGE